jgi:hypothetical protein
MKGLASVLLATLVVGFAASAGPLELFIGAGPSATSLAEINSSVGVLNTLIAHLNETFDVHPDVTGTVAPLEPIGSGLSLQAGERYWILDWLSLGGRIEYASAATATAGQYQGSEVSHITIDLGYGSVGIIGTGRAVFLDAGLQLAADLGAGYYYAFVDRAVMFEVPSEYPEVISGIPPEGDARYSGGTFGFELGLALDYPVTDWLVLGSLLKYQAAQVPRLQDAQGTALDLDGDGTVESITLDGVTVALTFSIRFDLSPMGERSDDEGF